MSTMIAAVGKETLIVGNETVVSAVCQIHSVEGLTLTPKPL